MKRQTFFADYEDKNQETPSYSLINVIDRTNKLLIKIYSITVTFALQLPSYITDHADHCSKFLIQCQISIFFSVKRMLTYVDKNQRTGPPNGGFLLNAFNCYFNLYLDLVLSYAGYV